MNSSTFLKHTAQFILFVALQVLLVDNLVLFGTGCCFKYIAFLLFLPIGSSRMWQLFLGFMLGFTVDMFYDTVGIHAAASVLLAFLRPLVLNLLTPRDGYDTNDSVNIHVMGWRWFLSYIFILILFHHAAVFFLETINFQTALYTLTKIIASTFFTATVMVILQLLFFSPKRERVNYR